MKKLFAVLVTAVIVWGLPGVGAAQAIPGMERITGLFGQPASYRGNGGCDDTDRRLTSEFSVYYGWLEQREGSVWALQRQQATGTAAWPLRGSWLQATEELTFDNSYGLVVSGGIFFPKRPSGTWYSVPAAGSFDFDIASYHWGFLDGLAKVRVSGGLDILGGFRWDRTSVRVDYSDNTTDDYILNAYLPLIGAQLKQPISNGLFLVRVVGAPLVRGRVTYQFSDGLGYAEFGDFPINAQSSFVEVLADCKLKMRRDILAGGFVKYNMMRVRTDYRNLAGLTDESVAWVVNIKSWVIGGVVSVAF